MKNKKFKLDTGFFTIVYLSFILFGFIFLVWFIIVDASRGISAGSVLLNVALSGVLIYLSWCGIPFLFTAFRIKNNAIIMKRFSKEYTYLFSDIAEIAVVPYRTRDISGKRIAPYLVISKVGDITKKIEKVSGTPYGSSYVNDKYFVISRNVLYNLDELICFYKQTHTVIHLDLYRDCFSEEELSVLGK
jgi:hypothetical protein